VVRSINRKERKLPSPIEIRVICDDCGKELTYYLTGSGRMWELQVDSCEGCVEAAEEKGREAGYEDGLADGKGT